jgi:hypothetical protein
MASMEDDTSTNTTSSSSERPQFLKRSDVWTYIRDNNNGTYTCLLCPAESGNRWTTIGTGTFRKHLKTYHRDVYSEGNGEGGGLARDSRQTDLLAFGFERYVKQRVFDKRAADNGLVDLIVVNSLPLALVEKKEFRAFCTILQPEYTPPTRKTVRKWVIQRWRGEKAVARRTLVNEIDSCRVSTTTDMWTSAATKGYMVLTLHWINAEWKVRSVMLGFTRVEYPHTGPRLAKHLIDTVKAMDSSLLAKLWAITADNAANNRTMVEKTNELLAEEGICSHDPSLPKVVQIRCLAHVLQLAVKAGLKNCERMDESVGDIRDILKKLSDSPSLLEALQGVCAALDIKFVSPELDCVTRWNSTLTMLMSARSLRKAIEELLRRIREKHEGYKDFSISPSDRLARPISETTWSYLVELMTFLTPIKAATTLMSGKNYPTFGVTLVVMTLVAKHASKTVNESSSQYTKDFASAFKAKIDEYMPLVKTPEARIAAVLDPRSKAHVANIDGDIDEVKRLVEAKYEAIYRSKFERTVGPTAAATTHEQEEEVDVEEALYGLIDEHLDVLELENDSNESFRGELNRWLEHRDRSITLKTGSRAVCNWMKNEAVDFPRIQMMARDYLAVMATSVPSEEAFSASGTTISARRARLGDDAVTAICELQAFLAFNLAVGGDQADPLEI